MGIVSLELWDLAQIIPKFSKMSAFDKFQDKKSPKQVSNFSVKLLQSFMLVRMGSKEAGWFTSILIYLYPVTEYSGENSPFVLRFGKSHHNFASH